MIFGYTLEEARKAVIAFITFGAAIAALFIAYDPGINEALITLVGAVAGVVGVFMSPYNAEDLSKAVSQLQGAALSLVGFWVTVDPSLEVKIGTAVAAALSAYAVFKVRNKQPTASASVLQKAP